MRSAVTMMVWSDASRPVCTSSRFPARMRVRVGFADVGDCAWTVGSNEMARTAEPMMVKLLRTRERWIVRARLRADEVYSDQLFSDSIERDAP